MNYGKFLKGQCYCEHPTGEKHRNDVICINDAKYHRLDVCDVDQGCFGPTTPVDAGRFSKSIFCLKGKAKSSRPKQA